MKFVNINTIYVKNIRYYENVYKNYIFKISLSNILDFISGKHNYRLIDIFVYFFLVKRNLENLYPDNFI